MSKPLIVILGPTSSGKTRLAVALARKFNGEIVSADSRQVYRGLDIGTGKDLKEYGQGARCIPYHLIDVVNPKTQFSVGRYQKLAYRAIDDILRRGKVPFLVGGTGLYIQAIVDGLVFPRAKANAKLRQKLSRLNLHSLLAMLKRLDLKTYKIIDQKNRRRVERALEIRLLTGQPLSSQRKKNPPPYDILQIGIDVPKEKLYKKIDARLRERLKIPLNPPFRKGEVEILSLSKRESQRGIFKGLIGEVYRLHKQGLSWKRLDQFGLEYRFVSRYLRAFPKSDIGNFPMSDFGKSLYDKMFEQLSRAIKNFAKRQMTWFSAHGGSASGGKRDNRIHWITKKGEAATLIKKFLH